uniref:Uncharacterized protein n=1 Tax=Anopheles dirus TaxID=7168 RepID=A0A182NWN0_9DIPT
MVECRLSEDGLAVAGVSVRGDRGGDLSETRVGQRGGDLGNGGNSLDGQRLTVDDGVESVDRIGGVLDDALRAIGFDERVRAGHNISRAGLLLALVISGQCVRHGVAVAVLWVGVVVAQRSSNLGHSRISSERGRISDSYCAGGSDEGGKNGKPEGHFVNCCCCYVLYC